jgi:nucleoside-triphosphatase
MSPEKEKPMKILITGRPGIGKTTLVKKVIDKLGKKAEGFFTGEIRDEASGERSGFKVTTTGGKSTVFASKSFESPYRVSSYRVDVKRFEELALPAVEKAMKEKGRIIVIDEIGKMELFSKQFVSLMEEITKDPDLKVLATIPLKDIHPVVKEIKEADDAVLVHITEANREEVVEEVLDLLKHR